ncbi:MAG: hypothetical protein A3A04_01565 [Candidatus Harrisonbacteria bacterium RIFCSPLOWO2_01_FULL_40_28]|uniref:EamA domain-containing protein n=2 Tax=Candidatus Harrisoniibacteriota TaxID=1817905 RepID=A0A1G1ZXB6_9BACT|nr:MAG: hypothetical protein A3A04_01565 [Candidatus Harrisonbacteria bacterium RIFCSPLOWO2_01_FULL_40_28]OGY69224.1 MAG: hypothetical protein A2586_01245 [Candidatus Harrisonbacteria bacterium RIFOXYD1_FULL_40_9]
MNTFIYIAEKLSINTLLILSSFSVILGDLFAKYWSENTRPLFFGIAILGYLFSGLFYIPTLLREGLVITSTIWTLISNIGFVVIGLLIFKESLNTLQIIGVTLGFISLIILAFSFK